MNIEWASKLDNFGAELLHRLGHSYSVPRDHNPVTMALEDPRFVESIQNLKGFSKAAMSRVAVACQMVVYDNQDGPDRDGKRKSLRRQWYRWYKTRFAQPFSAQLAILDDKQEVKGFNGTLWAGRMSGTYAHFVNRLGVTYWDLWVIKTPERRNEKWLKTAKS